MLRSGPHLRDLLSPDEYYSLADAYKRGIIGRTPKLPTWDFMAAEWDVCWRSQEDPSLLPYFVFCHQVITLPSGRKLPVQFCRDEEVHDRLEPIAVLLAEAYSSDIPQMFLAGIDPRELAEVGLQTSYQGLANAVVKLKGGGDNVLTGHLRRFWRYHKLVSEVQWTQSVPQIVQWIDEANFMTMEYWQTQGITGAITNASMVVQAFTGVGFDAIHACRVTQSDGTWGVGVFTEPCAGEFYWDFSRRGIGSHIGNNILIEGILRAQRLRCHTFNLGVAYYKWKELWSQGYTVHNQSIRLTPGDSQLRAHSLADFRRRVGFAPMVRGNKEREE